MDELKPVGKILIHIKAIFLIENISIYFVGLFLP
jgi:hypothetical protein